MSLAAPPRDWISSCVAWIDAGELILPYKCVAQLLMILLSMVFGTWVANSIPSPYFLACAASAIDRYKALGASVVGVSGDDITTLDKFSVSECQSKFPLVADADRKIMKAYDSVLVPLTSYASRTSYVITPDDRVLYSYTALSPEQHVTNTYNVLAAWRAQHPTE